jgi:hypothetical protein
MGHHEEFLSKLPSIRALQRLLKALSSELSHEDDVQTLETALTAFNFYRHAVVNRPVLHAKFNPIFKAMIRAMISELRAAEREKEAIELAPVRRTNPNRRRRT